VSRLSLEATALSFDTEVPLALETAQLTITSHISVGCGGGAQVVVCTVAKEDGEPLFKAIAKTFDALYYCFSYSIASRPRDVTAKVDKDYAAESAVY